MTPLAWQFTQLGIWMAVMLAVTGAVCWFGLWWIGPTDEGEDE